MLDNTITLPVDLANTGSTTDVTFSRLEEYLNRSVYKSAAHTLVSKDTLSFYRTQPTKSGNFNGVAKSAFKFSKDIEVEGVDNSTTLTAPVILEVKMSLPIGFTAAEALELRQRAVAVLDDDDIMAKLMEGLEI